MATDTHDKMIAAFQEYFKWQDRFEWRGSDEAGIKSRFWLAEIRRQAHIRRKEIQDVREARRIARNERRGQPPKITI